MDLNQARILATETRSSPQTRVLATGRSSRLPVSRRHPLGPPQQHPRMNSRQRRTARRLAERQQQQAQEQLGRQEQAPQEQLTSSSLPKISPPSAQQSREGGQLHGNLPRERHGLTK
jgi:hypothetical protein